MSRKKQSLISDSMLGALIAIIAVILVFAIILSVFLVAAKPFSDKEDDTNDPTPSGGTDSNNPFVQPIKLPTISVTNQTKQISADSIDSEFAFVYNVTDNTVIASRKSETVMYPASMTKVMTLIVVMENIKSEAEMNEVITIDEELYNMSASEKWSGFGFKAGDTLTVKDLIYAMILQSDNIAAVSLARHIAGTEAAFVTLMNKKAEEMGLSSKTTLFQNCTGMHHSLHYTTCKDMTTIMYYAMHNTHCADVLRAKSYSPSSNFRQGQNITFWHAFLTTGNGSLQDGKIQPNTAEIIAGKTGLTEKDTSGYCLVSYAKGKDGKEYIVVTGKSESYTLRLEDTLYLYNTYAK